MIASVKSDSAARRVSGMSSSVIADRIFREHQYELPHMIDQPRVDSGLGMFERLQQLLPHPAVEAIARTEFDLGTVDQQAVDRDRETIGRHQIGRASCRERGCPYV